VRECSVRVEAKAEAPTGAGVGGNVGASRGSTPDSVGPVSMFLLRADDSKLLEPGMKVKYDPSLSRRTEGNRWGHQVR
jgi:hypothetical protein